MNSGGHRFRDLLLCSLLLLPTGQSFGQTDPFVSSNLPLVIIDTHGQEIPDDPKITADMGIIDNGPGQRNAITDSFNVYSGPIGIEIRGSSSQEFPKKQYGIETRDTLGTDVPVSLLGLPPDADWVLSAGYDDKSLMRNALAYYLAARMGRYASRSRFCELVLNGEYMGVYVLFERVKRDKNRVNITKLRSTDISGDALTGGYIIKIDWANNPGDEYWDSPYLPYPESRQMIKYLYDSPKPADLLPVQKDYIREYVTAFEKAVIDSGFVDAGYVYSKYLDRGSAVDYFLVNELARNVDAYRASFFLSKDRDSKGGKLMAGPIWDFNAGFGNVDYYGSGDTVGWNLQTIPAEVADGGDGQVPFWWVRIGEDSSFWKAARERWGVLRNGALATEEILGFIDSIAFHINEAQARNFERWPILDVYVPSNAYVGGTYENEIAYLKRWTLDRMGWMDQALHWVPPPPDPARDSLRVHFGSFTAQVTDSVVALSWQTTLERNTTTFTVQRRISGTNVPDSSWTTIGTNAGADTSSFVRSYARTDTLHINGLFRYRLKVDGKLGDFAYSDTLDVLVHPPDDTLRVQIAAFAAEVTDFLVVLSWQTAREKNTARFAVQRRFTGPLVSDSSWVLIGTVVAADTSTVVRSYAFTDTLTGVAEAVYRLKIEGKNGDSLYSADLRVTLVGTGMDGSLMPDAYALQQNYPNPFNPSTTIAFDLPHATFVTITVYDCLGRQVAELVRREMRSGKHQVHWDAAGWASGVYLCRIQAGEFTSSRKMLLMR